jgi:hypothetical protein
MKAATGDEYACGASWREWGDEALLQERLLRLWYYPD